MTSFKRPSLRSFVLAATGQDLRRCRACAACEINPCPDCDIRLDTLVQMVLLNDEEVLTTRTLWSENALRKAYKVCSNGIDLPTVILALREEAQSRKLV